MIHKLEADGIQLSFSGRPILSDVYITAETGKVTALLGRNGQGKSCLMQIIYGTLNASTSAVRFDGAFVRKPFLRSDLLSYLPQFNIIPKNYTLKRVFNDFKLDYSDFARLFPLLESHYNNKFEAISGGQRRIVELYVIIKTKSQFTMLDEPFSHLSPIQVDQIKELINQEKENKGFIITDHMYHHVLDISDITYVLRDGKVHQIHTLTDIGELGYARV